MRKVLAVLLSSFAALGACRAQSGSFVIPSIRDSAGTDFAYWDLFARPPGSPGNTNYNYANPPALLDGTGEDGDANPTTAFAPRATLTQNGTSTAFVTSSGAIYSFSDPIDIEVNYQPPAGNSNEVTNVIFQTQTGGARIDIGSIRLRYTNGSGTHEVAPAFKALDDPQTGAFSERIVSAYQWNLTGLGVTTFKIVFPGPTSMPLWQAQLDVVQGTAFSQQLGYVLRTRARPTTLHEVPGTVDKNLPPSADGRFFMENDTLNLLAVPEPDWEHTGWEYAGQTFATASLPLIFPAADAMVTALFAPSSYAIWQEYNFHHANALLGVGNEFLDDAISAPQVDHDNDQLTNAGEYAFAGDPYVSDTPRTRPQLVVVDVGGTSHPALRYRSNGLGVGLGDVIHIVQLSTDGNTWADNNTSPTTTTVSRQLQADGSMLVTERALLPVSSYSSLSMRVAWSVDGVNGTPLAPTPLTLSPDTAPDGFVGRAYVHSFTASGGAEPYAWTLASGTLPAGLSLAEDGTLSGMPTTSGTSQFTLQLTDGINVSKSLAVEVHIAPYQVTSGPALTTAVASLPYSFNLALQGGTPPFNWGLIGGNLPSGLSLHSTGNISGTTSSSGTSQFTVEVEDANGLTVSRQLQITSVDLIITTPSGLPGGVINVPYQLALSATGGVAPFTYEITGGSPPAGMTLVAGVLGGTPTTAGGSNFTVTVTDNTGTQSQRSFSLTIHETFQRPVITTSTPPVGTVGMSYNHTLGAINYPKAFSVGGLPAGLKLNAATGTITGRPNASGVFAIQVRATNTGGTSAVVTLPLVIKPVPTGLVGTFSGWIDRNAASNTTLGSRWSVTTTGKGTYSAKLTTGATTKSATGFLSGSAPHVSIAMIGQTLDLTINEQTRLVGGTHGGAIVHGWRSVWNSATNPAQHYVGGYSVALSLGDPDDDGVIAIPQGTGFASFTIGATGSLTVAGKVADGQSFSSAASLGPNGEIAIIAPLYKNQGSLLGEMAVNADASGFFPGNTVNGSLTWQKPATNGKIYPEAFGPVQLDVDGAFLTNSFKSGIVLGLPATSAVDLLFSDGGLDASATDPDSLGIPFNDAFRFVPPITPVKHSLSVNKTTGNVTGSFTLTETAPPLTRKVSFQAQIVRTADGNTKALGYFLLPQTDASTVLSGGVKLEQ